MKPPHATGNAGANDQVSQSGPKAWHLHDAVWEVTRNIQDAKEVCHFVRHVLFLATPVPTTDEGCVVQDVRDAWGNAYGHL